MKKAWILALLVVISITCCKMSKYDPADSGDSTKLKKYVIYDTEKMKTNVGNDCPSRKKGTCVCKIDNGYVSVGNEVVVSMGLYDDKCLFVAVENDYRENKYVVEQDWVIWDKEMLEDFGLKEPVLIKVGKYDFYKSGIYERYALLPIEKADLKERVAVFMEEKEWRAESFYEGYLGECNVLTGIVRVSLPTKKLFKGKDHLTIVLPYENNVQEGGDRLMEIIKEGRMILKEDVWVRGLNVNVKKGIYRVKKVNEGAMVELAIDN